MPSLRRAPYFLVGALSVVSVVSVWPPPPAGAASIPRPVAVAAVITVPLRPADTDGVAAGNSSTGSVDDGSPSGAMAFGAVGTWQCPIPSGRFTNDWGAARTGGRRHEGTDLLAAKGTLILAPVGGTFRQHDNSASAGHAFYLAGDDGMEYFGAHLDAYAAPSGRVERGMVIGLVGDSGNARGTNHLHFEMHPTRKSKLNPYFTLDMHCP